MIFLKQAENFHLFQNKEFCKNQVAKKFASIWMQIGANAYFAYSPGVKIPFLSQTAGLAFLTLY